MTLKFINRSDEVKDVVTFNFEPGEVVDWQPGQYMHYNLDLPDVDDKGPERWFTISSAPFEKNIHITTRLDNLPFSSFKKYLMNLKPGDEIEADGPGGKFILRQDAKRHVLIAGGIGITPYRSMLAQLAHDQKPANAVLMYANRDENFIFMEELEKFASQDNTFSIQKFVNKRISEDDIKPYLNEDTVFYLSGPQGMVESYEELLPNWGLNPDKLMKDYFPGY